MDLEDLTSWPQVGYDTPLWRLLQALGLDATAPEQSEPEQNRTGSMYGATGGVEPSPHIPRQGRSTSTPTYRGQTKKNEAPDIVEGLGEPAPFTAMEMLGRSLGSSSGGGSEDRLLSLMLTGGMGGLDYADALSRSLQLGTVSGGEFDLESWLEEEAQRETERERERIYQEMLRWYPEKQYFKEGGYSKSSNRRLSAALEEDRTRFREGEVPAPDWESLMSPLDSSITQFESNISSEPNDERVQRIYEAMDEGLILGEPFQSEGQWLIPTIVGDVPTDRNFLEAVDSGRHGLTRFMAGLVGVRGAPLPGSSWAGRAAGTGAAEGALEALAQGRQHEFDEDSVRLASALGIAGSSGMDALVRLLGKTDVAQQGVARIPDIPRSPRASEVGQNERAGGIGFARNEADPLIGQESLGARVPDDPEIMLRGSDLTDGVGDEFILVNPNASNMNVDNPYVLTDEVADMIMQDGRYLDQDAAGAMIPDSPFGGVRRPLDYSTGEGVRFRSGMNTSTPPDQTKLDWFQGRTPTTEALQDLISSTTRTGSRRIHPDAIAPGARLMEIDRHVEELAQYGVPFPPELQLLRRRLDAEIVLDDPMRMLERIQAETQLRRALEDISTQSGVPYQGYSDVWGY